MKTLIFRGTPEEVHQQLILSALHCKMHGLKPTIANAIEVEYGQA